MSIDSPGWLVLGALVVVAADRRRRRLGPPATGPPWPPPGVAAIGRRRRFPLGLWFEPRRHRRAGGRGRRTGGVGPGVARGRHGDHRDGRVEQHGEPPTSRPTRLEAAKKAATAFVNAQPSSVDIGVVAFQTGALTTNQPSADHTQAVGRDQPAAGGRRHVAGRRDPDLAVGDHRQDGRRSARTAPSPNIGYWGSATIVLFGDGGDDGQRRRHHGRGDRGRERRRAHRDRRASAPPRARRSTVGRLSQVADRAGRGHPDRRSPRRPAARTTRRRTRPSSTGSPRPSTCG